MVGTAGVGYRRLSTHEHAYVGANVFYDYAFKNKFSRISAGLEYVAGLNTTSVNVYRGFQKKRWVLMNLTRLYVKYRGQ